MIAPGLLVMLLMAPYELATLALGSAEAAQGRRVETYRGSGRAGPATPQVQHPPRSDRGPFLWPVQGRVTSHFGRRGVRWHSGTDIKAPRGTPIRAAAAGKVVFSGRQSGYGRVIKIDHRHGVATVYAHNDRNLVSAGDRVKQGAVIGTVGRTGRATANHVHFEIRRGSVAQNPVVLLARRQPGPEAPPRAAARSTSPRGSKASLAASARPRP